ncbi:thiamine pyrophosphate-binding protein [Chitinivorax sp. B]|uniref:thiamine pyrophosphate-binding protein n=1 Tax=Chitinivorax sp. B TaxID=2502235 RepID=UPI0010F7B513|nr:thiamine pyrophosphate-binding protein [Chitinivorax sp. B]
MSTKAGLPTERWARDYVFDVLNQLGIHYIFGVPGTNEIPIIDGTSYPENEVEYIECLHENIALGAAMGSARMTGKPGVMLVHITPGIAHAIGNLFNAWRSRIPLVVLCAQQQNELVTQEPLLASNLVDLAKQYTKWAHEVRAPEEIPLVLQRAFKEAMSPPNGPVFVSIPWEYTMRRIGPDDRVPGITQISSHFTGDAESIKQLALQLAQAKNPIIVAGDAVGYASAWPELQQLAELVGAPVLLQSFSSVANFPNNDYHWQGELPTSQSGMQGVFKDHDVAFLCGFSNQAQITIFKYSDGQLIPSNVKQLYLTNNTWDIGKNYFGEVAVLGDIKATLPLINDHIRANPPAGAGDRNTHLRKLDAERRVAWDGYLADALKQDQIWSVVIADALRKEIADRGLSKQFVYVHEAVSDPAPFQYLLPLGTESAAPMSYYCVGGGSLGWSMPASLGIKLESQGAQGIETKLVVNAVGDGSSLFYPQCWWTAGHRNLAVLYIITNNHEYHTLQQGLVQVVQAYGDSPGYGWYPKTMDPPYLRIRDPAPDYLALAKSLGGVDGEVVDHPEAVRAAIRRGIDYVTQQQKPFLLDMRIAQDTPAPPSTDLAQGASRKRMSAQPPLNVFHQSVKSSGVVGNSSVIF